MTGSVAPSPPHQRPKAAFTNSTDDSLISVSFVDHQGLFRIGATSHIAVLRSKLSTVVAPGTNQLVFQWEEWSPGAVHVFGPLTNVAAHGMRLVARTTWGKCFCYDFNQRLAKRNRSSGGVLEKLAHQVMQLAMPILFGPRTADSANPFKGIEQYLPHSRHVFQVEGRASNTDRLQIGEDCIVVHKVGSGLASAMCSTFSWSFRDSLIFTSLPSEMQINSDDLC